MISKRLADGEQEPEKATDYTSQTLSELDKVQSKAILLNDMLNNATEGERIGLEGDVYEQVAAACRGARPKIVKWIEDDTGEREGVMGSPLFLHLHSPPSTSFLLPLLPRLPDLPPISL